MEIYYSMNPKLSQMSVMMTGTIMSENLQVSGSGEENNEGGCNGGEA